MTLTPTETSTLHPENSELSEAAKPQKENRSKSVQPVLEKLFELYPALFGAEFLPLKLGVFQELLAKHPERFERAALKAALGVHTRSTRYLQCVAAGKQRHDLQGVAIESVAPEHIGLAMIELFRRRQARTQEDLRPKLHRQLAAAFEASGLSRQDYLAKLQTSDVQINALLEEVFSEHAQKSAKQEALRKAFEASGQSLEAFAEMYGMDPRTVASALQR
jgi:sRNA-binding protein